MNDALMNALQCKILKLIIFKEGLISNKIEEKKYYYPLDKNARVSVKLFRNIICLPLNLDIDELVIDKYINIIKDYI